MEGYFIVLAFVLVIGYLVLKVVRVARAGKRIKSYKASQDNYLRSCDVTYSKVLEWYNEYETDMFRVIFDDDHGYLYVSKGTDQNDFDKIPYSEIIDFQVIVNECIDILSIHYIETFVSSFEATIYRQNLSKPRYVFDFVKASSGKRMNPKLPYYKKAVEFVENLHAVLKVIKSR